MAFTLNLNFLGLCMFVPDLSSQGNTLVLMPTAGMSGDIPPHVAMLCVDVASLQPGSSATTGQWAMMSLQSAEISFSGSETPTQPTPIPSEIANVGEVAKHRIIPAVLGTDPSAYLNARVVLTGGTLAPAAVECWRYPAWTPGRQLAQGATWTVQITDADQLSLSPGSFEIAPAPRLPTLYPVGAPESSSLDLLICNTAVYELPIMPQSIQMAEAGKPGRHFKAFYSLFEMESFDLRPDPDPCSTFGAGELPYTCMGPAQSVPDPV